jgi:uncharacterized protein (DUF488 family)
MTTIFTIGHSNHSAEKLVDLLKAVKVTTVVDVRTAPYSRYNPQFNQESLESVLAQHHIGYAFGGKQLGGRPADPACYKSRTLPEEDADYLHEVDYPAVMQRDWFLKGIERLQEMAAVESVVILCSEEDPAQCHRHHLIARYLMAHHPEIDVQHVRGDGMVFSARTILKSVDAPTVIQQSLF